MKFLTVIFSLFVFAGCSMTPKVGDRSDADYPIALKTNSSPALIALSKTPIKGVRDLSLAEFKDAEDEVKKFEAINASVSGDPLNPNAYAVGSVAVGASLGLGLDYVSGVALLGRLAADNRPENFDFSNDFSSYVYLYSPVGSKELKVYFDELMLKVVVETNALVENIIPLDREGDTPVKYNYNKTGGVNNYHFSKRTKVAGSSSFLVVSLSSYCKESINFSLCGAGFSVYIDRKETPLASLLVEKVAKSLPKGSLIYLPPRKDLNRIPMVYNSDGEVMYLVETE